MAWLAILCSDKCNVSDWKTMLAEMLMDYFFILKNCFMVINRCLLLLLPVGREGRIWTQAEGAGEDLHANRDQALPGSWRSTTRWFPWRCWSPRCRSPRRRIWRTNHRRSRLIVCRSKAFPLQMAAAFHVISTSKCSFFKALFSRHFLSWTFHVKARLDLSRSGCLRLCS